MARSTTKPRGLLHALAGRLSMNYQRRAMTALLLVFVLDYGDRTLIGALGPTLEHVFHIGNGQLGLLAAAFAFIGAPATIPLGMLVDRVNRTLLLAISLVLWALAMGVTGAAISFAMLFGARLFLGVVAATTGPTTPSLTGDLVPSSKRGAAFGFINSGQLVGDGVGFILPVVVLGFVSWRWCFWILGIAGLALAFAFWRLREPERTGASGPAPEGDDKGQDRDGGAATGEDRDGGQPHSRAQEIVRDKGIQPSQRAILRQDPATMSLWAAVRYVVRVRTDIIVLVARSLGDYFFAGVSTFAIVFATHQYGLSQSEADLAILVLGIGALSGVLFVGRIADAQLRRGRLNSRLWLGAIGYILAPFPLLGAFLTHSLIVALPLFIVGAFFLAGAGPPLDAVRIDVVVPRLRGRAEVIRQVLRTIVEGGAPLLIGVLSGVLAGGGPAGLQLTLIVLLPVLLVNGIVLLFALRTYQPDIAAALASTHMQQGQESPDQGGRGAGV